METTNVRLVDRTFDVLEALSWYPEGTSIAVLTEKTGIHKSTIYRLLNTLINRGYIIKDDETSKYRMTLRTYQSSHEAVHLAVPDGASIVYLFKEVASENVIRIASQTGSRNYMYYTGLGKALMATMSESEVRDIWEHSEIIPYTPHTITKYSELLKELEIIRKRGYAIDDEEHESGIVCIADVIRDSSNKAVAALSISTLASRMDQDFLDKNIPLLKKTVSRISSILGYVPDNTALL